MIKQNFWMDHDCLYLNYKNFLIMVYLKWKFKLDSSDLMYQRDYESYVYIIQIQIKQQRITVKIKYHGHLSDAVLETYPI